ncbi:hypothetical protein LTR13_011450 [Exophiala sideris]|nr:hypothetical protein LTR13_011450 [Exophiala sideris]
MTGVELIQDINAKAGKDISERVRAVNIYPGGHVRIYPTPYAQAALGDISWMKKWAPSAALPKKDFDLAIARIPVKGTAEEPAARIEKENEKFCFGLKITRAVWLGNPEGKDQLTIKITLESREHADRLIINGITFRRRMYNARRYVKNFIPGKEYPALFGKVGEGRTSPVSQTDSLITDEDLVFSSSSEETQSSETGKRKMLNPILQATKKSPRGRPVGSLNKPKLGREPAMRANPFQVVETQPEKGEMTGAGEPQDKEMSS